MDKIKLPDFDSVCWKFPTSNNNLEIKKQDDFLKEYHPSGHKILNPMFFPDIETIKENVHLSINEQGQQEKKVTYTKDVHFVNRATVTYQMDALDILMAHLFGYDVKFNDISLTKKDKEARSRYSKYMEVLDEHFFHNNIYEWVYEACKVGHSAIHFFYNENKEIDMKVYSYSKGDKLYCQKDIKGNDIRLYRQYAVNVFEDGKDVSTVLVDVIDKNGTTTYNQEGEIIGKTIEAPLNIRPFGYLKRSEGAIWTPAQSMIDETEKLLSRLSEDNKTKAKSKYIISGVKFDSKTKAKNYTNSKIGEADYFVAGDGVDLKMIQGASLSEAFKFEYETNRSNIFNSLGIVYPEQKSSGDMPTGSMKIMFFPTERKCKKLIREFSNPINEAAKIFQAFAIVKYPTQGFDKLKLLAYIKLFTPQDDMTIATMYNNGIASGAVAKAEARIGYPNVSSDNLERCELEEEEEQEKIKQVEEEADETVVGATTTI